MTIKQRSISNITAIGFVLIAMLVLSACGGDDAPADVNTSDTSGVAIESATSDAPASGDTGPAETEPTVIPENDPPAVAVTLKKAPEPGSMEEEILNLFEQQVRAMNTQDYESFLNTCAPGFWDNDQTTWDKLAFWWEQGGDLGRASADFTFGGFNARDVDFRLYPKDILRTDFNVYKYETPLIEGYSWWWEKVDDEWYSTSRNCTGATGRQTN